MWIIGFGFGNDVMLKGKHELENELNETCLGAIIGRNIAHVNLLAMLSFIKLCKLYTRVVVFIHCNFRLLFIALLQIINNFCHFPFEMKEPKADRAGESPSLGWVDHYVCTTSKWIKKKTLSSLFWITE